jgi:hypothetical protein
MIPPIATLISILLISYSVNSACDWLRHKLEYRRDVLRRVEGLNHD